MSERQRIDIWLFRARFMKTRAAATRLVSEGGVRIVHDGVPRRLEKPSVEVAMQGENALRMQKLLDAIEALDDVQEVHTNAVLDA